MSEVVFNQTGHALVRSTGYYLRRLAIDGTADTNFGVRYAPSYFGGTPPDAITPNGGGYSITSRTANGDDGCAPVQPVTVVHVNDRGEVTSSTELPAGLGGGVRAHRLFDGSQLVVGLQQVSEPIAGGYICVGPRSYRLVKLIDLPPAPVEDPSS